MLVLVDGAWIAALPRIMEAPWRKRNGGGEHPSWLSAAATFKMFQNTIREYRFRPENHAETLQAQLRAALLDGYQRNGSKTTRNYPRKKKSHGIGERKITPAFNQPITIAQQLKHQQPEFQLMGSSGAPFPGL